MATMPWQQRAARRAWRRRWGRAIRLTDWAWDWALSDKSEAAQWAILAAAVLYGVGHAIWVMARWVG